MRLIFKPDSYTDYFRPTKDNFFGRIPEPHFTKMVIELMGQKWSDENHTKKRAFIAERMELAVAGDKKELARWLPKDF